MAKTKPKPAPETEQFPNLRAAPIVEAMIYWMARAGKPFPADDSKKQLEDFLPEYPTRRMLYHPEPETRHGLLFESADGSQIVQFTNDRLLFSRLKPYQNWQAFTKEGKRTWSLFVQLARPTEVQRLGVRFVNRLPMTKRSELRTLLRNPPRSLAGLGELTSFLDQWRYQLSDFPLEVNVIQTVKPPKPAENAESELILDIDVSATQSFSTGDTARLDEMLGNMRWAKNKAFFGLISDVAIDRFRKGGQR